MHIYIYIYIHIYIYVYTYVYIYIYICIYVPHAWDQTFRSNSLDSLTPCPMYWFWEFPIHSLILTLMGRIQVFPFVGKIQCMWAAIRKFRDFKDVWNSGN